MTGRCNCGGVGVCSACLRDDLNDARAEIERLRDELEQANKLRVFYRDGWSRAARDNERPRATDKSAELPQ